MQQQDIINPVPAKLTVASTDGPVEIQFAGNINTSSFLKGFIEDMDIQLDDVDITGLGNKQNLNRRDVERFFAIWEQLAINESIANSHASNNPEYYRSRNYEPALCLPTKMAEFFQPTETDIEEHVAFLTEKLSISKEKLLDMPTVKNLLAKKLGFMTYVKYINMADFLGIEVMKTVLCALFAGYLILYQQIRV